MGQPEARFMALRGKMDSVSFAIKLKIPKYRGNHETYDPYEIHSPLARG
jgi:hypothetical protein